ncbi:MAG TPA: LysR family transcriptional regulator ArgP [Solirubrobacteraceae bacterium]|jgi:LysR family transcriptional regulator (chromosome initiation inhibitor)|nr:LysR family transcriptional regulator ArgP [Solirubrobacteraceae bacterium]
MMDLDADQLRTLAAVIDQGTFERAAEALRITPSAVSQRMKALEQRAGRVLVLRTKPIWPTAAGSILLRLARQVALLEAEAIGALGSDGATARPVIPLVVNADSLATWVLPALASLPEVSFDIVLDDQAHTLDRLREGTVMAAITSQPEPLPGCVVTRLGSMRYRPCASPGFVARWLPNGFTRSALGVAPMLVFDRKDALQDRYLAAHDPGAHPPRHHVPASADFVRAAELGLGWGMLPDLQSDPLLADGRLVVLDTRGTLDVPLYWQQWAVESGTLASVAAVLERAAAVAIPLPANARLATRSIGP